MLAGLLEQSVGDILIFFSECKSLQKPKSQANFSTEPIDASQFF
jgi:hypothetical protein